MEIDVESLLISLQNIVSYTSSSEIQKLLNNQKKKELSSINLNRVVELLCNELMVCSAVCVEEIGKHFTHILLLIVCKFLEDSQDDSFLTYQKKCIALSKLLKYNRQVVKYTFQYFTTKCQAPFSIDGSDVIPKKRSKQSAVVTDLEMVECCLNFLKSDLSFFRNIWSWDEFIELYWNQGCDSQKLLSNEILSLLFGMTKYTLNQLNADLPDELKVRLGISENKEVVLVHSSSNEAAKIHWDFNSEVITNVEGVFLPVFEKENYKFYQTKPDKNESIVKVDSTRINLRSLALGISSGKAICLSGPVGCGKTTLVEYLARIVGRLAPKLNDFQQFMEEKSNLKTAIKKESPVKTRKSKRKLGANDEDSEEIVSSEITSSLEKLTPKNGFLRIQLGDQTDSKVLLGQYRCTDVPGEFVWQPGVLTQAVLHGYWLLLEDLDSATQDVATVLTNLMENHYLSVPGFREHLKITSGFQLFVTLRTQKSVNPNHNSTYSLMEKHLYTINVLPLSRNELSEIICQNFPKLSTVSKRIVDVFLQFSSGCHSTESDSNDLELILGEKKKISTNGDDSHTLPFVPTISLASLPNSGRLVSTRDLLKLCSRSNPTFSVTSSECAYFVFQNCVDIFCSHLTQGPQKTELIVSIGAKLGIIRSRCEFLSNEFKPVVDVNSTEIKVGRVTLSRNSKEKYNELATNKRIKLELEDEVTAQLSARKAAPTFSFTRLASCVLERISVAVQQNEPVLLVGETGVGKTSSIQYLAHQTNHKLVVVNMNNQSDVSDLIGGFKPVDISFIIAPLRNEFEYLFGKTFDPTKNEKFLTNVSVCFNRGDFGVLVKLMLKVCESVYTRLKSKKGVPQAEIDEVVQRWQSLQNKLNKLDQQLKNSINLSFAFIPGSLVNCIKNGDWVLLDEINLASTETLECLSTILEPDGSIILLERGDFEPIKRHPDFRIFSCMNPNTDVGKKDLPVGIRNRFTEFFVDELTAENDLLILVGDYLNNTGIQKSKIFSTVKLYMRLRNLSQLDLNDGLGNKPVFSLRTLCRALRICAKNLCGSIERNLYESFCLSFLTQLDSASHDMVLVLIQKMLLSDTKKVLSQPIPRPSGQQINFEGYWVEHGAKEVNECKEYILTESVKKNLRDLSRIISIGKLPILLQGPTSAGKTSLIEYIAKKSGNYCLRINNHEHTDLQEYIGTYVADVTGKLTFMEGVLVQAMRNGHWIILDELNLAPSDILEALNRVLDDNRELYIPETQVVVKAHPNFMLFATQNPPGLYGGRKTLSRAFKNRFIELHFSEIPRNELEIILEQRCLIPKSYAQKMVKTMSALQINRRTSTKQNFTLRDLFRWGNRYTFADPKLSENKQYDWNQHLVDEGYLVLSAKVRNQFENAIIADALFQNFRHKIDLNQLFDLNENTSLVTKTILQNVSKYSKELSIVWTYEMRRMAVLTAKALEFNEPVLLVGPTGCGKTTICQILADIKDKQLRILNCHMHTEGADFLGGLRPHRENAEDAESKQRQLFEWADGPLILSMIEGSFFLADEISLAEDSVLERLNCVLEPDRTILLAEKGGIDGEIVDQASDFVIKANESFQFLATMNPGGDFGKKELSPALRNRFTEIWCTAITSEADLIRIAYNSLCLGFGFGKNAKTPDIVTNLANILICVVTVLKETVNKLNFSIRDVLAWVNFITTNYQLDTKKKSILKLHEALLYGLQTLFLDSLEMLHWENPSEIFHIRKTMMSSLEQCIVNELDYPVGETFLNFSEESFVEISKEELKFGIDPFFLPIVFNPTKTTKKNKFSFSAPTTKKNLFRVLSALSLKKAILLEGAPGVGKTSLIENIADTIGFNIVRINLCEHTDLADLFGTDLPAEDKSMDVGHPPNEEPIVGAFVWRDGPLLAALKAENTWILLDELNLAPQSVLEGLNAILDHRGEVYIPELNKTFKLGQQTRIFGAQNPLRQGGGRKGLPQSFLNRFTKVYLSKLEKVDLMHVVEKSYGEKFRQGAFANVNLVEKMVTFSQKLEEGLTKMEFGYRGGPYEANLRDILRWCKLFYKGFDFQSIQIDADTSAEQMEQERSMDEYFLVLFEKMKLVYCQRMRMEEDKDYIYHAFSEVFVCEAFDLEKKSRSVSLYWNDNGVYLSNILYTNQNLCSYVSINQPNAPIILSSQLETLKNIAECLKLSEPVILCGSSDCGKTKLIDTICSIFNNNLHSDTIDDSITGSFQQFDFNRLLEQVSQSTEVIMFTILTEMAKSIQANKEGSVHELQTLIVLMKYWGKYNTSADGKSFFTEGEAKDELKSFDERVAALGKVIKAMFIFVKETPKYKDYAGVVFILTSQLSRLLAILEQSCFNSGGRFEWVNSVIVKSILHGQFVCLENVNLASSAILDRLNPVLEPNGTMLISEKGVGEDNKPEVIKKHKNFRIFLTLDPKHGEISRAMRNRCIELAIPKETYTEDDLRKIIYREGVHEMYLIKAILKMHYALKEVTEYNSFGIANVIKFAFLVSQNKSMGVEDEKSLLVSALEVYVRSSNVDLLGFGLSFYRDKLKAVVLEGIEELRGVKKSPNVVNYENVILKANQLTTINLIKLQAEPFVVVLNCKIDPELDLKNVLMDLSTNFSDLDIIDQQSLPKYLLYILYEMSTIGDFQQRAAYIHEMVSGQDELLDLVLLNANFMKDIKFNSFLKMEEFDSELPWNTKMFPRISYNCNSLPQQHKMSLLLLLRISLDEFTVKNTKKLAEIDALAYSKAINNKTITDNVDDVLITNLYGFLNNFENFVEESLKNDEDNSIDDSVFVDLVISFLWFNRLLETSKKNLFLNKNINEEVLIELKLHFNWINKFCMESLPTNLSGCDFKSHWDEIRNYLVNIFEPHELFSKMHSKIFNGFLPFSKQLEIDWFNAVNSWNDLGSVVPKLETAFDYEKYQARLRMMTSQPYQDHKKSLANQSRKFVNEIFKKIVFEDTAGNKKFIEDFNEMSNKVEELDFNQLKLSLDSKIVDLQEPLPTAGDSKFKFELTPIFEYLLVKMMYAQMNHKHTIVNTEFCTEIRSLNFKDVVVVNILQDERLPLLKKFDNVERYQWRPQIKSDDFHKQFATLEKTIRLDAQSLILKCLMLRPSLCLNYDNEELYEESMNDSNFFNGPLLTNSVLSLLMNKNGTLRGTGLGEISEWKSSLRELKQLLWSNAELTGPKYDLMQNNIDIQMQQSASLLEEIRATDSPQNDERPDFTIYFFEAVQMVKDYRALIEKIVIKDESNWKLSFMLNAFTAIVELNLLTYFPLMDPVKKSLLKARYVGEDIDHLQKILQSYEFMAVVMDYKDLGDETREIFEIQIESLRQNKEKYSKKVAIRPEVCQYISLVKDVTHYLSACCHPRALLSLVHSVKDALNFQVDCSNVTKNQKTRDQMLQFDELINKIDLWISNANKFEHHTLRKYTAHYRDFVAPIECSITNFKHGILGLKQCLKTKKSSIHQKENDAYFNINANLELQEVMNTLIEFPACKEVDLYGDEENKSIRAIHANIFTVLQKTADSEQLYFKLIKAKMQEIQNTVTTNKVLVGDLFKEFDKTLNVCNQMWHRQEEIRKKKQAEEDSLYVTKTKCAEEDEELVKLQEIHEMFPNYADEDFNEFIQNDTLEQIIKIDKIKKVKHMHDIIATEDYQFVGESFVKMMSPKASAQSTSYLDVFSTKLNVFHQLFMIHKTSLPNAIDEAVYRSLTMLVGLSQESYDDLALRDQDDKIHDFYKDSNITEATNCIDILRRLELRVNEELAQWPEHAVLEDLLRIINRIRSFPANSPLVRFNVGLQILRQKVDEWNSVAHRLNNFKELEFEIVDMIMKWMRMELQCWRESLQQTFNSVRGKAYRYWFFLYNLIHEFLTKSSAGASLMDFKKTEKRFADDEILEEKEDLKEDITMNSVTAVLKQFIEAANYAEFGLRMQLLKSFEFYLLKLSGQDVGKKAQLIATIHNLHMYYNQFSDQVEEHIVNARKPVEKKLKEFVKIESFNKDLSYFSMRSNINRVHRHLHKILKEFETEVKVRVTELFKYKETGTDLVSPSDDPKNSIENAYSVDVEQFLAARNLKVTYAIQDDVSSLELIQKIDQYFVTSRNIVKKTILQAHYPSLVENFNEMMKNQLETASYLRGLEVDRSLPKQKQKSQAKHILNQKRKALSDFYKVMQVLGVNYKTGLMKNSMNPEHADLSLTPFEVQETDNGRIKELSQNLDYKHARCVFKIKSLMNMLLTPRPDLDQGNLERMRGLAVELFLMVQSQRESLAGSVNKIKVLQASIRHIEKLHETDQIDSDEFCFDLLAGKFNVLKRTLVYAVERLEQFSLLLKCAPLENNDQLIGIKSTNCKFIQKELIFAVIRKTVDDLLREAKAEILVMSEMESDRFKTRSRIAVSLQNYDNITSKVTELKEFFVVDQGYSIYGTPICDLADYLVISAREVEHLDDSLIDMETVNCNCINTKLEKLTHSILIAIQNVYKKSQTQNPTNETSEKSEKEEVDNQNLLPNHLKDKLDKDLLQDIELLSLEKINAHIEKTFKGIYLRSDDKISRLFVGLLPMLKQYSLLVDYYFLQQLSVHTLSTKMLTIMLSVFLELTTKGFCIPQDLMADEQEGQQENDGKTGEGFGFEDGEGEKDASDKLESEDQLEEAKKPEDYKNQEKDDKDCKEENGIDMSDDFEGKMQDVDKKDPDDSDNEPEPENEEMDKEMGETEEGAEKLDDQVWGDEENKQEEEEQDMNDEEGKGSGEKDDKHNDLGTDDKNEMQGAEEDGLDAADNSDDKQKKKEQQKDIDKINEEEGDDDQTNPYHNELEEPPMPDDMDLDDNVKLDNEEPNKEEPNNDENPFDIDTMKEQMEVPEDLEGEADKEKSVEDDQKNDPNSSDDEQAPDEDGPEKFDENPNEETQPEPEGENEDPSQVPDKLDENEPTENNENKNDKSEDNHESKDQSSKEDNVQSMPNEQNKGSNDQVQTDTTEDQTKQKTQVDEQDTGEEKDGIGQAENEESKSGHQGVAETKESQTKQNQDKNDQKQQKRKKGNTDEERTLGEVDKMEKKTLKTIDKLNRKDESQKSEDEPMPDDEAEEFQHVKDAKQTDKTTLDNATEEQSKKIQHDKEKPEDSTMEDESHDQLPEDEQDQPMDQEEVNQMESKTLDKKSEKPAKSDEQTKERLENPEEVVVEGENVLTYSVARGSETTAHCQMNILNDNSTAEEPTNTEALEMRKMVEDQMTSNELVKPTPSDMESWQEVSHRMMSNARELCEQLRLILEPTKCTRLKGDYRTGRRINMKKIIPYIASQFRKDKIWLRRTKAAQRDYKITIAVDDSKSMHHNNSKVLTMQAISLVSQALTLLESGKLSVVSFGEAPKIILKYNEQFDGPKMVKSLDFEQNHSRIAELLDFTRTMNQDDHSSDNGIFEHLLLVLSDGRNIFSEGEVKVRNAVKLARMQRMFIVYIIIDNPENKHSILDIRNPQFSQDKKTITMHNYLDSFPFPYYVIVRDLGQLPLVLSDAMRQWFELVNSE